jgi:hypothetical protein
MGMGGGTVQMKNYYIESHSICLAFFFNSLFRKAQRIVFHRSSSGYATRNRYVRKLTEFLMQGANRGGVIQQMPMDKILSYEWECNKEAALQISAQKEDIYNSFTYNVVADLVDDKRIIKYFQAELTRPVSRWLLYEALCKDLLNEEEPWEFTADMANGGSAIENYGRFRLMLLRYCSAIAGFLRILGSVVVSLFIPVGYVVLRLPRGFSRKNESSHYDIAMPVMWGFQDGGGSLHGGVQKRQDDTYLYGEGIKPGRIVHIFGKWAFSPEKKSSYKEYLDKHGLAYADSAEYRLTGNFLRIAWRAELALMKGVFSSLRRLKVDRMQVALIQMLPKLLYYYLEKRLELENVLYDVELVRDDYNAGHVVNSLICRKRNIKTLGIQHTASPYDAPQLAFVEFDHYCSYGKLYEELFSLFWDEQKILSTGREGLDWVIEIYKDPAYIDTLKERMGKLYQERKYTVVVLFPGVAERCLINRWKEMFRGLEMVQALDLDVNVFLRFRSMEHLEYEYTRCFKDLTESDPRFILDHDNFLTQDLMAVSDLIITPNASLGINEASAIDKAVLTFDYTNTATLYFDGFGNDFVMTAAEQVKRAFMGLKNSFGDFDCDWSRLKEFLNHHTDGRNCERLRDAVEGIAASADIALSQENAVSEECV